MKKRLALCIFLIDHLVSVFIPISNHVHYFLNLAFTNVVNQQLKLVVPALVHKYFLHPLQPMSDDVPEEIRMISIRLLRLIECLHWQSPCLLLLLKLHELKVAALIVTVKAPTAHYLLWLMIIGVEGYV